MSGCSENKDCSKAFDVLFEKIDRLDTAIRGNGKPGILLRLDRLEQGSKSVSKFTWLVIGGLITGALTIVFAKLMAG